MGRFLPVEPLSQSRAAGLPLVSARSLHKAFGSHAAVRAVDLHVHAGEMVGLLGPNGAGKTTTMQMLAGALRPDAGAVRIAGGDPRTRDGRRAIGIAPQELAIYPELTAEENLAFFARLHGLTGQRLRQAVDAALELAALAPRRRRRVETLSGGMQRRLSVACATVHGPEVLLLDEPTAGVDPQSRHHIHASLLGLRARGVAIVYSTHYLEEAEQLCDRVVILDRGRVVAACRTDALDEALLATGDDRAMHAGASLAPAGPRGLEAVFLGLTGRAPRDA